MNFTTQLLGAVDNAEGIGTDFGHGDIAKGIQDYQKFKQNPFSANAPTNPTLTDDHFGQPDANGIRPINDSGFKHIDNHISTFTDPDNSSMIAPTPPAKDESEPSDGPGQQHTPPGAVQKAAGVALLGLL